MNEKDIVYTDYPCNEACPKCSGKSIKLKYYGKGDWVENKHMNKPPCAHTIGKEYSYKATKDFILMLCYTCEYEWVIDPL